MLDVQVAVSDIGQRADVYIAEKLPEFTRSSLGELFRQGFVLVNAKPIKASYKLKRHDRLQANTSPLTTRPVKIDLPVLYEDGNVIVIDKPAGILTHSKGTLNTEATVASFIKPKLTDKNLKGNRAGIVHRLDRATSGVIIAAKKESVLQWLQKQFSTRKVKKIYEAIVEGVPQPAEAIIDAPIERNPKRPQSFRVGAGGRPAKTRYKILTTISQGALLELQPLTGRTHQLRVHMKYIGHPIIGDHVYGKHGSPAKISPRFQADTHLYLHAKSLELILTDGRKHLFEAPEPNYFKMLAQP